MPPKSVLYLTPEEARVAAHVCGDGYLCLYKCKRALSEQIKHPRKNAYRNIFLTGYCNTEPVLLDEFKRDVWLVYGLKVQFNRKDTRTVRSKWVFERIKSLGGGKSRDWFISKEIIHSNKKIICAWLRAFFDDEAHIDPKRGRICVNSVNFLGLKQVCKLLKKVGVRKSVFYGPYKYNECISFRLTIPRESIKDYFEKVGFNHPAKIKNMQKILVD
jgi:hypothetical protein